MAAKRAVYGRSTWAIRRVAADHFEVWILGRRLFSLSERELSLALDLVWGVDERRGALLAAIREQLRQGEIVELTDDPGRLFGLSHRTRDTWPGDPAVPAATGGAATGGAATEESPRAWYVRLAPGRKQGPARFRVWTGEELREVDLRTLAASLYGEWGLSAEQAKWGMELCLEGRIVRIAEESAGAERMNVLRPIDFWPPEAEEAR